MSTSSNNVGIANSWSLKEFARSHGTMKVTNDFVNSETGETFKSCAFVNSLGGVTLVGFSSNLSSINTDANPRAIAQQIAEQKDNLQVVELETGNFKLCKAGNDSWTTVDLGI